MTVLAAARGVYPIAPTPFLPDGAIDWASFDRLFAFYGEIGVDGLTVLGLLGEAPKLDAEESRAVIRRAVTCLPGLPLIVGVSAPGFAAMRALAREAMELGAAGVMVAPPNTLRTDESIVAYYAQAAEALGGDVPIVIQDYPLTLSVVMTPGVIARIADTVPSVAMLKHEDWPGLGKISLLRRWQSEGAMRRIAILCGNGGLFLDFESERGADGANTGYAFPEMLQEVVRWQRDGQRDAAHDLFDAHLPLLRYEQQPGIGLAVRKYVLMRRGLLTHDAQRRPGGTLGAEERAEVEYLLTRLAKNDPRAALG